MKLLRSRWFPSLPMGIVLVPGGVASATFVLHAIDSWLVG